MKDLNDRPKIVAIIDDDSLDHFIYKHSLRIACPTSHIIYFFNATDAIDFFVANADSPDKLPDVVIFDLRMPLIDGWNYLIMFGKIKESLAKKNIYHYACTCSLMREDVNHTSSDLHGYYIKPILPQNFVDMVTH